MNRPVPSTLSVRVPFSVRKRGGRKLVITPGGAAIGNAPWASVRQPSSFAL